MRSHKTWKASGIPPMMDNPTPNRLPVRGRGASHDLPNRFERLHMEPEEELAAEDGQPRKTQFHIDRSRSVISRNSSPDLGFSVSLNPYRGCEHGCSYCYARPTHEYLGFSAGLDFESRIMVKPDAPELLRKALSARAWRPRTLALSGVTDPYQPVERRLGITRACLKVLLDCRHPVSIVTKNHLVTRDIDILARMAEHRTAMVTVSITTLRKELRRVMEPRTSIPARRLAAVRGLADAGIPVGVNVAPVIPGLNDHELPEILAAAREAGASHAGMMLLRLPFGVKELFAEWLDQHFPDRRAKVLGRLREVHGGRLYDSRFGRRGRGRGAFAEHLWSLFRVSCRKLGLKRRSYDLATEGFRRPERGGQMRLFAARG